MDTKVRVDGIDLLKLRWLVGHKYGDGDWWLTNTVAELAVKATTEELRLIAEHFARLHDEAARRDRDARNLTLEVGQTIVRPLVLAPGQEVVDFAAVEFGA